MASDTIRLQDNICPICLYIFIQPVTMPCEHELCLACFKQNVEEANFCCPLCRTRISTWARRAARTKTLVNNERWTDIQHHFPEQVKNRLEGVEDDEEMQALNVSIRLAEPGEIRNEYEEQLKKLREQRAEERSKEQEASEKLIKRLQEEERKKQSELSEIARQDEQLAKELSQADKTGPQDATVAPRLETSSSSSGSQSHSGSIETFLEKMQVEASKSPYPYPCLSPLASGEGKLCVEKDKVRAMEEKFKRQKIRKDKNLITTQDIATMEEQFKLTRARPMSNADAMDIDCLTRVTESSHSLTLPHAMSSASLNQNEILIQMSEQLVDAVILETSETGNINDAVNVANTDVACSPIDLVDLNTDMDTKVSSRPTSPIVHIDISSESDEKSSNAGSSGEHERSLSVQSCDSITQELNHFRPIRSCPLTPPRKLLTGQVVEPQIVRTTPKNISKIGLGSPTNLSDIDAGSPIMRRRLSELAEERKDQVARMSKSTSTGAGSINNSENKNPQITAIKPKHKTDVKDHSRNVEFRDISNSPSRKRKSHLDDDSAEKPAMKRKLIIPLEADLIENDVRVTDPLINIKHSPSGIMVTSNKASAVSRKNRLSRRKHKSDRVRYSERDSSSTPQPSITKWMTVDGKTSSCLDTGNHNDCLMASRRDEIDGNGDAVRKFGDNSNRSKILKCKKHANGTDGNPSSVHGTMDRFLSSSDNGKNNGSNNTRVHGRRKRTALRSSEYVYDMYWKKQSKDTSADATDEQNETSGEILLAAMDTNSSSCDGFCSDGGSESSDEFQSYFQRKHQKLKDSSSFKQSPRKRQTENQFSKARLKQDKTSQKHDSSGNKSLKQAPVRSVKDFFTVESKYASTVKPDDDEVVYTQEELDRKLAEELQKQFKLEAKLNLNTLRFKGSSDEYSFRKNRKRKREIDV